MKLIDKVMAKITDLDHSGGAYQLATAMASACSSHYKFAALDCSVRLDEENKQLVVDLLSITSEPDFSNADQDQCLRDLRETQLIDQ
ncbi:MAG: hypothetical protein HRU20_25710 [Pseudomonadales bacterium]|nr:hypothetical protein [Pseudomonadales bacterium]